MLFTGPASPRPTSSLTEGPTSTCPLLPSLSFPNSHLTYSAPAGALRREALEGCQDPQHSRPQSVRGAQETQAAPHTLRVLSDSPREAGTFPERSLPRGAKQI